MTRAARDEKPGDRRQRHERRTLFGGEDFGRPALRRTVNALIGDAFDPAGEVGRSGVEVGVAGQSGQAVPIHVPDARFDLALLLRLA